MKMSKILSLLLVVVMLVMSMTACFNPPAPKEHVCESKCETCNGCTDAACTESACATKCQGHTAVNPRRRCRTARRLSTAR